MMHSQSMRFLALLRELRGTPHEAAARELLHALRIERRDHRRERKFRKQIEALRRDQSARLYASERERCRLVHEKGQEHGDRQ